MTRQPRKRHDLQFFLEKYSRPRSEAGREVERSVLGHEFGLNGYTTVAQAGALCDAVAINSRARLLDIGSGYGWPGLYVAMERGCEVVSTDMPLDALDQARANARQHGMDAVTGVVAADARDLPFGSESFDAVVHADVLC